MDSDLQYCIIKLSQANPQTLKRVRNLLDDKDTNQPDCLISLSAAAKMLGVSRTTFWRMIKHKVLPVIKPFHGITRIRMSDIQALISSPHEQSTTEDVQ